MMLKKKEGGKLRGWEVGKKWMLRR